MSSIGHLASGNKIVFDLFLERGMKQEGEMLEDEEGRGGYGSSADEDNLHEQMGGSGGMHIHGGSNGVVNGHHGNYEESGDEENEDETEELDYSNIPCKLIKRLVLKL